MMAYLPDTYQTYVRADLFTRHLPDLLNIRLTYQTSTRPLTDSCIRAVSDRLKFDFRF
jgi:hypothetical protein